MKSLIGKHWLLKLLSYEDLNLPNSLPKMEWTVRKQKIVLEELKASDDSELGKISFIFVLIKKDSSSEISSEHWLSLPA